VLEFTSDGELGSESAASAIRDGIGRALMNLPGCSGEPGCSCVACAYFKPTPPPGYAGGIAPGFVLEMSRVGRSPRSGVVARANLILIGAAREALPWFLFALTHSGQVGIGDPRARFTVDCDGDVAEVTSTELALLSDRLSDVRECEIKLGPLILCDADARLEEVTFPRLVKAICERLQPNVGYWCGAWMRNKDRDVITRDLVQKTSTLEWAFEPGHAVREVSKKFDGRVVSLLAFTGKLNVRGELKGFWPLLLAGSLVHIGELPHLNRGRFSLHPVVDGRSVACNPAPGLRPLTAPARRDR